MSLDIAATITIGAALTGTFVPNVNRVKGLVGRIGDGLDALRSRQKELKGAIKELSKEESSAHLKRIGELKLEFDLNKKKIEALKMEKGIVSSLGESYEAGKQRIKKSVVHIGAAVHLTKRALGRPLRAAIEHESGMLGVAKQMDGLRDEKTGKLTDKYYQVEDAVWGMSEKLPIAVGEIRGMLESAGQMGIKEIEQAEPFVLSVGKTAIALDLDRNQAATDMAKLATIFQIPVQDIEHRIGDAINKLADNSTATGSQIINILKRIGGNAKFANMSEHDSAALSAFMMSVSTSEEVAATAANALIRELSVAEMQPDRFQSGLATLGLDAKKLQQDMAQKPTQTILEVLKKLNAAKPEERATISTQLFGKEYGDDVAKAAIGIDTFENYLRVASSAEASGSIQREFDAKQDSMEYKLQRMNNQLERLYTNLGQAFIGPVGDMVELVSKAGKALAAYAKEHAGVFNTLFSVGATLVAGGILTKVAILIYGFGQAVVSLLRTLGKAAGLIRSEAKGFSGIEERLLPVEERRDLRRRRRMERVRGLGRSYGRARAVGGVTNAVSIGMWGRGASVLDRLSGAWRRAGSAARLAGRGFSFAFRLLGGGLRGIFNVLRLSPLGMVSVLLESSISMILQRWDSFKWFFDEVEYKVTHFKETMDEISKASGYDKARTLVSDGIESFANWWNDRDRVRADASVMTSRDVANMVPPPPPPDMQAIQPRAATVTNDHSTTNINVVQKPGEDSDGLARRIAQELEQARTARQRGVIYDPVGAF
nr:MAG TPA: minor tail protein [Caudoviricetes sp.]